MAGLALLRAIGEGAWLTAGAARGAAAEAGARDRLATARFAEAFAEQLWRPLPLVAALALLAGVIAGVASAHLLALYHAELLIEPAMAHALLRDVAPLVVGTFAAGRIAVGIANRLAGMTIAREIDALEALGHDPVRFALAPQLGAVLAAVPVLAATAGLAALVGAGLALAAERQAPGLTFAHLVLDQASARALLGGVGRVASYALTAFAIGAAVGARGAADAAGLAQTGARAFVAALLAVFGLAALWAALG